MQRINMHYMMSNIRKTNDKIIEFKARIAIFIAMHHNLSYYSFAGFLLLLLWNPVF